jgi:hypothetical protein
LPSCRALSQVETRCLRSRCSVPFFRCWSPPQPLCSRRPHRTFTIPLSPLCRAIVQVETRSWCAHGSRCPLWRRAAAAAVLSPSTLDVCTALAIVQGGIVQVETRSLFALMVLDALLWRRRPRHCAAVLSPSTLDICTALASIV